MLENSHKYPTYSRTLTLYIHFAFKIEKKKRFSLTVNMFYVELLKF